MYKRRLGTVAAATLLIMRGGAALAQNCSFCSEICQTGEWLGDRSCSPQFGLCHKRCQADLAKQGLAVDPAVKARISALLVGRWKSSSPLEPVREYRADGTFGYVEQGRYSALGDWQVEPNGDSNFSMATTEKGKPYRNDYMIIDDNTYIYVISGIWYARVATGK